MKTTFNDYIIEYDFYSKQNKHVMSFDIKEVFNGDEIESVFMGSIKWDGCSNWHTNKNCTIHFCGLEGVKRFHETLNECYRIAKEHLGDDCD